ncbi:MAG: sensor histidine kinase [Bryobacteraceae bacterium]
MVWTSEARWRAGMIGFFIVGLSVLDWTVPLTKVQAQNLLNHLNFIPILLAGMLFGWRGAVVGTLFTGLVQAPQYWITWGPAMMYTVDHVTELSIFGIAGVVAGFLTDRERRQRAKLEKTTRELEGVYQELRQNVDRLRKAERLSAAGQLSAGLAHEIRNPLASIAGAAGILRRGHASGADVEDCLEIIDKESHRLNRLLSSFLEFARPRAPRLQRTDLAEVIESVRVLAGHAAEAESIEIRSEVIGTLPEVECDPEQIKQVLLNLLLNAIQATPGQGIVRIRTSLRYGCISIAVQDEGAGIPPEHRDHIFDPFFTTKDGGTGLGLAVAAKILEQHGGQLTAENNSGKGATFCVELPLDRKQTA